MSRFCPFNEQRKYLSKFHGDVKDFGLFELLGFPQLLVFIGLLELLGFPQFVGFKLFRSLGSSLAMGKGLGAMGLFR